MEIKIEGNPGTGNTFQEINIGTVLNYNPAATTVINHYGTNKEKGEETSREKTDEANLINSMMEPEQDEDITPIRKEILNYVSCLRPYLKDEWKSRYMKVWEDILDIQVIADNIYKVGKQQNTNFNRNLVANILFYFGDKGAYKEKYNASAMAEALEGDKDHSVRAALGKKPEDNITSRLDRYFE